MRFGKHAFVGLLLDTFDWCVIGMIPGVGDVVDVISILYWTGKLGPAGFAEALELIPGADVLPCNLVLGMMADGKAARQMLP